VLVALQIRPKYWPKSGDFNPVVNQFGGAADSIID